MEEVESMEVGIGIRKEDKNRWERRAPLIPEHIRELKEREALEICLQPSEIRAFPDEEYIQAGAKVREDLSAYPVIFGIKEMPLEFFEPGKVYVFFSHTIKGQPHNMPMLKKLLELGCILIDYERIVDERGRRLIFFGRHAGLAGMIDTLWTLGRRLDWEGTENPFSEIQQTLHYKSLEEAKKAISHVGKRIEEEGLPEPLVPLVFGLAGYGNVSQGAQEILDLLPVREIAPEELPSVAAGVDHPKDLVYKVVFKEEHMVEPISPEDRFELQDYYNHPEKYRSKFEDYLPYLTVLMNCIYWDSRYPRFVTKEYLRRLYGEEKQPRLRVIGDISCDVEGAVECTLRATDSGNPVFVYDPFKDEAIDGVAGTGPVVLAVDNLPCELPRESSADFSRALKDFVPRIAKADYSVPFEKCDLPPEIKKAVIAYRGELAPDYRYLEKFLQ
jgi:alpha-aminoadipic semialdehyde synthase